MNNSRDGAIEPNPIVAIWRSRWLVLLTALIVTGLGIAYAYFTPATYSSSVSVVLRNPANTAFLTTGPAVRDDRYVADQVDVIQSAAVAEEVAVAVTVAAAVVRPTVLVGRTLALRDVPDADPDAETRADGDCKSVTARDGVAPEEA